MSPMGSTDYNASVAGYSESGRLHQQGPPAGTRCEPGHHGL